MIVCAYVSLYVFAALFNKTQNFFFMFDWFIIDLGYRVYNQQSWFLMDKRLNIAIKKKIWHCQLDECLLTLLLGSLTLYYCIGLNRFYKKIDAIASYTYFANLDKKKYIYLIEGMIDRRTVQYFSVPKSTSTMHYQEWVYCAAVWNISNNGNSEYRLQNKKKQTSNLMWIIGKSR